MWIFSLKAIKSFVIKTNIFSYENLFYNLGCSSVPIVMIDIVFTVTAIEDGILDFLDSSSPL